MSARGLGGCAGLVALAFVVLVVLAWLLQRRMIYIPYPARVPPVESVLAGGREVRLETADGLDLGAWFLPAAGPARGAVVVFNGNAGNRSLRADLGHALAELGVDVLLFDYRGYGGNPGAPSESGLLADARAARAGLLEHSAVGEDRVLYFGESLGTGVAVALAAEAEPAGLVLRSPFASLVAVGRLHYPFLPTGLILRDRYPSARRIAGVEAPLLVVLGEEDRIIPPAMSRELFAAARAPKRLVEVPGAGHNDYELLAGERMMAEIAVFLDEVLPSPPPAPGNP